MPIFSVIFRKIFMAIVSSGQLTILDQNDGTRVGFLEVYQWAAAAPALPTGTSTYTWATGTFTAPSVPGSWLLTPGVAVAGQTLWATSVRVANALSTLTSSVTWTGGTVYAVGAAGTNGIDGTSYSIIPSSPVITKDAIDAATTGTYSSITIQGRRVIGATAINYGWVTVTANGVTEATTATDTASAAYSLAPITTAGKSSYTIKLYNQATVAGATLLDTQVIPVVFKGATGAAPIVGVLTNSSFVMAAASNGTGYVLTSAGGTFKVYSGTTDVTTSSTFSIVGGTDAGTTWTKVQNGLTLTINETTGVYTLSGASWTTDNETFTLSATYNAVTVSHIYSIGKAKAGVLGPTVIISPNRTPTFNYTDSVAVLVTDIIFTAVCNNMTGQTYLWYKDGVSLGITTATYTLTSAVFSTARAAVIKCVVTYTGQTYEGSLSVNRLDLSTAAANATVGATWGTNVGSIPANISTAGGSPLVSVLNNGITLSAAGVLSGGGTSTAVSLTSIAGTLQASHLSALTMQAGSSITAGTSTTGITLNANSKSIQVNDGGFERVKLGNTVGADYGLLVKDSSGNTIFNSNQNVGFVGDTDLDNYNVGDATTNPQYANGSRSSGNIAIGANAMQSNPAWVENYSQNVAIGNSAMKNIKGGGGNGSVNNIAIGTEALQGDITGTTSFWNIAIGRMSLAAVTASEQNISIGNWNLGRLTTGNQNICIGGAGGERVTTGIRNILLGTFSGGSSKELTENTFVGHATFGGGLGWSQGHQDQASSQYIGGTNNVVMGYLAMTNAGGMLHYNTAIGDYTLANLTSPNYAAVLAANGGWLGDRSNEITSLSQMTPIVYNTVLGYNAGNQGAAVISHSYTVCLGAETVPNGDGSTVIGYAAASPTAYGIAIASYGVNRITYDGITEVWNTPYEFSAPRFTSTATSGTAPFTVASTDEVANLRSATATSMFGGTTGNLLYQSGVSTTSMLADVATGNALISGGVGVAPLYGKIGLTTHISGTLPIANGGTNSTATATAGGIGYGTGTAHAYTAVGTAGQFLTSNAASAPTWGTLLLSDIPDAWVKRACKAATTADLAAASYTSSTITGTLVVFPSQDGIAIAINDRVLVKNQTLTQNNGIYTLTTVGVVGTTAWVLTRATDASTSSYIAGASVAVDQGTQGGKTFDTDFKSTDTLGTTTMTWAQVVDTSYTIPATQGGTGQTVYAIGDLLYASTTTAVSKLADVATGNVLLSGGVGVAPAYGKVNLTTATHVTGTLPVANGGTGVGTSTGTGSVVLSTSPTLTTPILGTPTSGNLANCTFPTLNQSTTGNAATATLAESTVGDFGFPVDTSGNYLCTIAYNETTRTVTVTPTVTSFDIYTDGIKRTFIGAQSIVHAATYGGHFIYCNAAGTIVTSTSPWNLLSAAPICYVFWDSTNSRAIPFDERHHSGRDLYWHRNQHANEGTKVSSGFVVSGYTLNDGTTDAMVTMAIASGGVEDEDIQVNTEVLTDGGPYTLLERAGASGEWRITRSSTLPFLYTTNNLEYNQYTGATWQRTTVTEDYFVNYYILVATALPTTSITPTPTATPQFLIVPGQAVYSSQSLASAESVSALSWGAMPFQEIAPLYKFTLKRNATVPANYANTGRCAIVEFVRTIGTFASVTQATQSDHGALSGLADQDHPASAIIVTPAGNIIATDVQAALEELDTDKLDIAGGTLTGALAGTTISGILSHTSGYLNVGSYNTGTYGVGSGKFWYNANTQTYTLQGHSGAGSLIIGSITFIGATPLILPVQTAKYVFAAPNAANGVPVWRQLAMSDISDGASPVFLGGVAVGTSAISTAIGINSRFSRAGNTNNYGVYNSLTLDSTALTADRTHYGAYNLVDVVLDNPAAFSTTTYGSYNSARTLYLAGNIDGEGSMYGSFNSAVHQTYNKTRSRLENAYGVTASVTAGSSTLSLTVTTTITSTTATTTSTADIVVGAVITGHAGIPASTTVLSITDATTFVMSAAATSSAASTTVFTQSTAYIDNAYGVYSIVRPITTGATINTGFMFYGTLSTVTGTFNNRWGVYIVTAVNNYFAGAIQIGGTATGTTSSAGLGVGVAPAGAGTITAAVLSRGAPVTKTVSFTLAAGESWVTCNGTGIITVTLPAASAHVGREVMIKTIAAFTVVSASSNIVPLISATAGTAILAATAGKYATLVSDGTNWVIMQAN